MARTNEPLWWALFAAGGMVSALLGPVTIVLTGIAVPAGWITENELFRLVRHPLTRAYLFLLIALPLHHWAHRFQVTLVDMGLRRLRNVLTRVCYTTAGLGSLYAAWVLANL